MGGGGGGGEGGECTYRHTKPVHFGGHFFIWLEVEIFPTVKGIALHIAFHYHCPESDMTEILLKRT